MEGYHDRLNFDDQKPRQIGVPVRIGITQQIARLKQRAIASEKASVTLVQRIPVAEPRGLALLKAEVETANARPHATVENENEHARLSGERLREMLPGWQSASVWLCGPSAFGWPLRINLVAQALGSLDFYPSLF